MPSAIRVHAFTRSAREVCDHSSNPRAAACAALSTSSGVPAGTCPMTSSVKGLVTGSVPVPLDGTQAPSR